jgi:hypothetical protein
MDEFQNETPESDALRCSNNRPVSHRQLLVGVVGRLNSKCPQQNRANENEHGAYGEHIQSQGKVHG